MMQKNTLGIILTEERDTNLGVLTEKRAVSALPIAGRYRLIDFVLSNMVNSGIINVGVAPEYNYSSLMDHLGSGKEWDLNRKNCGLYILPPYIGREYISKASGDVDVLYGVSGFLRSSAQEYVVLAEGHTIYNSTFNDALKCHIDKGADITIIYNEENELTPSELMPYTILEVDDDGMVTDIMKNHPHPTGNKVSLDTFIIEKTLLLSLIDNCVAHGEHDWVKDVLVKNLGRLKVYGHKFEGCALRVNSVESYYKNNMRFLESDVRKEMFMSDNRIYTKIKDQVPARYGDDAKMVDSMVADGCTIEGRVENSIIFRAVHIGKGAVVRNSIIMQNTVIEDNCVVENAVLDKAVILRRGKKVIGQPSYPFVIAKGSVV